MRDRGGVGNDVGVGGGSDRGRKLSKELLYHCLLSASAQMTHIGLGQSSQQCLVA